MTLTLNGVDLNQSPDWDFSWTPYAASFSGTVADDAAYADLLADVAASTVRAPGTNRYWLVKDGAGYATTVRWYRTGTNVTARLCCPTRSDLACTDVDYADNFVGAVGPWVVGYTAGPADGHDGTPNAAQYIGGEGAPPEGNFWGYYTPTGTFTAGKTYKWTLWVKLDHGDIGTANLTFGNSGGSQYPERDGVPWADATTIALPNDTSWHRHELVWTPGTTVVSDGDWHTTNCAKLGVAGITLGSPGAYLEPISVQECA